MHSIRLIGDNHTTHHAGTVLPVADPRTVATNRNAVTLDHARDLVERGEAEWVGLPPGGHEAEEERETEQHHQTERETEPPDFEDEETLRLPHGGDE